MEEEYRGRRRWVISKEGDETENDRREIRMENRKEKIISKWQREEKGWRKQCARCRKAGAKKNAKRREGRERRQ